MTSIPAYFTTTDYHLWSLQSFLSSETTNSGPIDANTKRRLGDAWNSTLLHYSKDSEDPRRAGWAERLRKEWKDKSTNTQAAFNTWILSQSSPEPSSAPNVPSPTETSTPSSTPSIPSRAPRKSHKRPRASPLSRITSSSSNALTPDDSISTLSESSSTSTSSSSLLSLYTPSLEELKAQYNVLLEGCKGEGRRRALGVVYRRAAKAAEAGLWDCARLWIVDGEGRGEIKGDLVKWTEGDTGERRDNGEEELEEVRAPEVPEVAREVVDYLEIYQQAFEPPTLPTLPLLHAIAVKPHSALFPLPSPDSTTYNPHPTKLWLDDCLRISHRLLSTRYLSLPLCEGAYDSTVHPTFWNHYFIDGPLWLQAKEVKMPSSTPLSAHSSGSISTGGHSMMAALRWDGLFLPKKVLPNGARVAFGVMEVCKEGGVEAAKARKDWGKLVVGCRECLSVLRAAVEAKGVNEEVVKLLRVVGVLLTGAQTTVMVMGYAGNGLYTLFEGDTRVFPEEMEDMVEGVAEYVKPIWCAKKIMCETWRVVVDVLGRRKGRGGI